MFDIMKAMSVEFHNVREKKMFVNNSEIRHDSVTLTSNPREPDGLSFNPKVSGLGAEPPMKTEGIGWRSPPNTKKNNNKNNLTNFFLPRF